MSVGLPAISSLADHISYLTSYPYLLSGPLHTYAGLLAFYLAQPILSRTPLTGETRHPDRPSRAPSAQPSRASSPTSQSSRSTLVPIGPSVSSEPPNPILLKQARGYFNKALSLNRGDEVALEFISLVSLRLLLVGCDEVVLTCRLTDLIGEIRSIPMPNARDGPTVRV